MDPSYRLPSRPVADPRAVVQGDTFRITVLTDGLLRLEYAADGDFEDRASTFALHRDLPVPEFRLIETPDRLEIVTGRVHLTYDRGPFSTSGLTVAVLGNVSPITACGASARPRTISAAPPALWTMLTERFRWGRELSPDGVSRSSTTPGRWSSTTRAG